MLEEYREEYSDFYSIINNAIRDDKLSHAYMFEIDDNIDKPHFIKTLCKALIIRDDPNKEYIGQLIDNDNYPNIKIISPDGIWIKVEQIIDLQNDFNKESFDNNLKIYVIDDATSLNKYSANALLKFLEEPEHDIIAILLTKNKYSVINTIVSRCINISLKKKNYIELSEEDLSYKIVELIEKYRIESLPYLYQLILSSDLDKKYLIKTLENVQKIYDDLLHINNGIDDKYNYFKSANLVDIDFERDDLLIMKKIESINNNMEYLKNNLNIKTFLDKVVIDVYGGE